MYSPKTAEGKMGADNEMTSQQIEIEHCNVYGRAFVFRRMMQLKKDVDCCGV
jgi:hypothetical protein